jgi:hypothetical protein
MISYLFLSRMALRISDLLLLLLFAGLLLGLAFLIDQARRGKIRSLFHKGISAQEE